MCARLAAVRVEASPGKRAVTDSKRGTTRVINELTTKQVLRSPLLDHRRECQAVLDVRESASGLVIAGSARVEAVLAIPGHESKLRRPRR